MSMIEDGTGTGRKAKVTLDNLLATQAETRSSLETLNEEGNVWSIPMDAVAPSGATKFLYILNNGTTPLGVALIRISSSVAGLFRFLKVTGTAAGGTAVVPTPTNTASVVPLPGGVQVGANITGLTDAGLLANVYCAVNVVQVIELVARWYVGPNTAIAVQAPGAATVSGNVIIYSNGAEG